MAASVLPRTFLHHDTPVIPNLRYAYLQRYEPGHLRLSEKNGIIAEEGHY
jgi:hypothetical protein